MHNILRVWVEEHTDTEYEVKETALGHKFYTGVLGHISALTN